MSLDFAGLGQFLSEIFTIDPIQLRQPFLNGRRSGSTIALLMNAG